VQYDGHDKVVPIIAVYNTFHPALPNFGFIGMERPSLMMKLEFQAELALRQMRGLTLISEEIINEQLDHELRVRNAIPKP